MADAGVMAHYVADQVEEAVVNRSCLRRLAQSVVDFGSTARSVGYGRDTAAQRHSGSGPEVDPMPLWKCQPSGPLPTLVFVRPAHGDVMCAVHRPA